MKFWLATIFTFLTICLNGQMYYFNLPECPDTYYEMYLAGDKEKLLTTASESFLEIKNLPQHTEYAQRYELLINAYLLNENWEMAYLMSKDWYSETRQGTETYIRALILKGMMEAQFGNLSEGINWMRQAIRESEREKVSKSTIVYVNGHFGKLLYENSDYPAALKLLESHLTNIINNPSKEYIYNALTLATVYLKINDLTSARRIVDELQTSELSQDQKEQFDILVCTLNQDFNADINNFRLQQNRVNYALRVFSNNLDSQSLAETKEQLVSWRPIIPQIRFLLNAATYHRQQKELEISGEYLRQAEKLIKKHLEPEHELNKQLLEDWAVFHWANNDIGQAKKYFLKASTLNYLLYLKQFSFLSEAQKESFLLQNRAFEDKLGSFVMQYHQQDSELIEILMNHLIKFKGLLFNQRYDITINATLNSHLNQLYSSYKEVSAQLEILHQAALYGLELNTLSYDSIFQLKGKLEQRLSLGSFFANLTSGSLEQSIEWEQIRDKLTPDEALIEIMRISTYDPLNREDDKSHRYVFIKITPKEKIEFHILDEPDADRLIGGFLNGIKYDLLDKKSYMKLFQPVVNSFRLKEKGRLLIVPDGLFHSINFNAFYDPASNDYLLHQFEFVLLGSSKDLFKHDHRELDKSQAVFIGSPIYQSETEFNSKRKTKRSFAFGDISYLEGTKDEVQKITGMLEQEGFSYHTYFDENASESNLKKHVQQQTPYSFIHLATHGFFKPSPGSFSSSSGLLFANAAYALDTSIVQQKLASILSDNRVEDGVLYADEASQFNLLQTDLIILSACETGVGSIIDGQGMYGLHRSFQSAGAEAVVMSLWKVDDAATNDFMQVFYKEILANKSKTEAWRNAQLSILDKYKYPKYWSAFNLIGR